MVKMAKKRSYRRRFYRKVRHRASGIKIPITVAAGLAAGMVEPVQLAMGGNWQGAMDSLVGAYTGYSLSNHTWAFGNMQKGMFPLVFGLVAHKAASMLGVNRIIAKAGVPIIRV